MASPPRARATRRYAAAATANCAARSLARSPPFLIVPVLTAIMGARAAAILTRINTKVEQLGGLLMPLILGAVGIALVAAGHLIFAYMLFSNLVLKDE